MYIPGTDWVIRTFKITDTDLTTYRRGVKVAKATAVMTVSALPSEAFRDFATNFPDALYLIVPAVAAAAGKRMRQNTEPEQFSSEAQTLDALYTPVPESEDANG